MRNLIVFTFFFYFYKEGMLKTTKEKKTKEYIPEKKNFNSNVTS